MKPLRHDEEHLKRLFPDDPVEELGDKTIKDLLKARMDAKGVKHNTFKAGELEELNALRAKTDLTDSDAARLEALTAKEAAVREATFQMNRRPRSSERKPPTR